MKQKIFPANVNWAAVWKHRLTLLNFINQVARGAPADARLIVQHYGGSAAYAQQLYQAAKEAISK